MTGVALAVIHDTTPSWSFHKSLRGLILHDLTGPQHLFGDGVTNPHEYRCTKSLESLTLARNDVARHIYENDQYEWLFWVDDDMGFEEDSLDLLLSAADPETRPIVGGLCFSQREGREDGYGGYETHALPTIMNWRRGNDGKLGFAPVAWYEPNALTKCDGTGSAFILIHRSVIEKIHDEYGPVWYDNIRHPEENFPISEDLSFCMRAGTLNIPVYVHSGVRTTHQKTQWVQETHFWEQAIAIPATEETAVLVPVLNRPQNAEPFMRSLRASTGLARAYAVCADSDKETWDAWDQAGAEVIAASAKPFAHKINDGYRATREPWLFIVGDDVMFWPGWLDHAQYAAKITGAKVVGTNDLGNPRVVRGEHATHMLISRSYVDERGASWDGPGVVCHEGYRHWYVDDEIVTAAKQRQVWSMALASRVEHLHPAWGKGDNDDTYKLGQHYADADGRLFTKRLAANV